MGGGLGESLKICKNFSPERVGMENLLDILIQSSSTFGSGLFFLPIDYFFSKGTKKNIFFPGEATP